MRSIAPPCALTFGSLFAGIGGFDLGLTRAGMRCAWQVEVDPFACTVLRHHFPEVARHDDVRTFPPGDPDRWRVDVICGGFPCQEVSTAGSAKRPAQGLAGPRSGLWGEFARVVRLLRPRYVVVENVPELLSHGIDRVLGHLAELGFDAEWASVPAYFLGAPHRRFRLLVVAYPAGLFREPVLGLQPVGDLSGHWRGGWAAYATSLRHLADGLPGDVVRHGCADLAALGNAVLPQLAEWVGRQVVAAEASLHQPHSSSLLSN